MTSFRLLNAWPREHRFPECELRGSLAIGERDVAGHHQPPPVRGGPNHRPGLPVGRERGNVTHRRRPDRFVRQRLGQRLAKLHEPLHLGRARRRLAQFRRCRQRFFARFVALPDKVENEDAGQDDEPRQQLEAHAALDVLRVHQRPADRPRGNREQRDRQPDQQEEVVASD